MKRCPRCQEPCLDEAIVCTHCGHQFQPIPAVAEDGSRPTPNVAKFGCAILILLALAATLWALTKAYQAQSGEAAVAVNRR